MADRYENRGVHISGGDISGQVAGGERSQVTQTQNIGGEVGDVLERLEGLLAQHAAELEQGDQAKGDLADVKEQVNRENPDKERVADTLARLARRVASVGAVLVVVKELAAKLGVPLPG